MWSIWPVSYSGGIYEWKTNMYDRKQSILFKKSNFVLWQGKLCSILLISGPFFNVIRVMYGSVNNVRVRCAYSYALLLTDSNILTVVVNYRAGSAILSWHSWVFRPSLMRFLRRSGESYVQCGNAILIQHDFIYDYNINFMLYN